MNSLSLYHNLTLLLQRLPMSNRVREVARLFTLGVLAGGSCQLATVARAISPYGSFDSQYRRLQRFLAHPQMDNSALQTAWAGWVLEQVSQSCSPRLLVDETKLSEHLSVMVLGLWVEGGCIPMAWSCYQPHAYPEQGQVALIVALLQRVMDAQPRLHPWLLADRGIGTSPALVQAVQTLGARVLFRVQGSTRFRGHDGSELALKAAAQPGEYWHSYGAVFKKAGWLEAYVSVVWDNDYERPWCLVSSAPVAGQTYGQRFQQECSFRDLKSDGFHWQKSHVWLPQHAERLILILAIAYAAVWMLGRQALRPRHGRGARYSTFRRGLEVLRELVHATILPLLPLPPPTFVKSVVH